MLRRPLPASLRAPLSASLPAPLTTPRAALLLAALLLLAAPRPVFGDGDGEGEGRGDGHAYAVLVGVGPDDPYHAAAVALARHHRTRHLLAFDPAHPEALRHALREIAPENVAVVLRPEQIEVNAIRRFLRFAASLDDDPFVDFAFGYVTGATAEEALAFVERIVAAAKEPWPEPVGRASVRGGAGPCEVRDQPYVVGPLAFPGRALTFVAPDGGHGRDQAFLDAHLARLEGCGAILMGGHGMPWEIASGPRAEDVGRLDLSPAVAFNYACYTGVTRVWPERRFEGGTYVHRLHAVEAERSFALATIRAGVAGYVAYVNPRPAGPEMTTEFERVLAGASLGEARRRDYDKIALGYLGFGEPGIVPPAWVDGERRPRSEVDAVRHMMLDGATGGILYGDPALRPYPWRPDALPLKSRVEQKGEHLHVTLTLEGSQAYLWGADPFRRFDADGMAMKLYDRVALPDEVPEIRSVRVVSATWGDRPIETLDPVWAVASDRGRRHLHLKANFARGGRGDIEVRLVAGPEAPPPDLSRAADLRALALQVGEAVQARLDALETPWAYDGKAGVAQFLFELFGATGQTRWRETADALLEEASATSTNEAGLYVGLAGVGQTALDAWRITGEARYRDRAEALAARLGEPDGADVISGAAGTGLFLLNLHAATGEARWLEAARARGAWLAEHAQRHDGRAWWSLGEGQGRVYFGFSHGAAGIGTFLVHLARATGDDAWLALAREAAAWVIDHAKDDPPDGWNWAKQPPPTEPDVRVQWCHGSPGIALFFLALADATGEAPHEAALGRALASTLRHGRTARAHGCLCHGKAGNADVLLDVHRLRPDASLLEAAHRWAEDLLDGDRVRLSVGERPYGAGLMTGLAGIGRFLLRLADPEGIPAAYSVTGGGPDPVLAVVREANRKALRPGPASDAAVAALAPLGPAGFRAVCRLIAAGEGHWRTHELLRALYHPGGEERLLALADGPPLPGHGRWTALQGLGVADTPAVRAYLLRRLAREDDAGLFMSAAQAAALLGETRAVEPIATRLLAFEAGWQGVATHLVLSLAALGPDAVPALEAYATDARAADAARAASLVAALGALETLDRDAARRAANALLAGPNAASLDERTLALARRLAD